MARLPHLEVVGRAMKEEMRHLEDQGGLSCRLSNIDRQCCPPLLLYWRQPTPALLPRKNMTLARLTPKSRSAILCPIADRLPLTASSAKQRLPISRRSTPKAVSIAARLNLSHMMTPTARRRPLNKPASSLKATRFY